MSRSKSRNRNRKRAQTLTGRAAAPAERNRPAKAAAPRPARARRWLADLVHAPENPFWRWFFVALLLIATWLVYMNGLAGGWLLDDYGNIVNNGGLAMHHFSWAQLWHAMWSFDAGPLGRPLSLMTFALERYFGGLDPGTFKTVNLAMHLAAVVLLYGFTRTLLLAWRRRRAPGLGVLRTEWVALAVAAAWALHPMNLTPILYAVQRETIFAALFTLGGLWLYTHLRDRLQTTWPVLILLAVVVAVFTVIGAYAKETGVLLPLFCLLVEGFVFRFQDAGENGETPPARKLWWLYVVLLFLPAALGLWHTLPGVFNEHGFVTREFNLPERVLTEGRIVLFYIGATLVPWLPAMALHHDYISISTNIVSPPMTLVAFIIIAALLVLAWWLRRRRPLVALGIFWFFASQVLESTIFPLELAYEHRIYLGDWGIILAVAALALFTPGWRALIAPAATLRERWRQPAGWSVPARTIAATLVVAVVVLLGSLTALRAWHWRSDLALAKTEARNHPQSPRGTYLLARIETNKALSGEEKFMQPAFVAAQKAAQVKNAGLDPWVAMILLAAQTGRPVPNAWFDGMIEAVGERPFTVSDVNALEALVSCYTKRQCHIQSGEIERLFRAIDKSPRLEKLGMNYANVLVTEANFIGYDTAAERARSAPKLLKAANVERGVEQFQVNVFNVALQDRDLALAEKMLARVEKLNKLGNFDLTLESMRQSLARAKATQSRRAKQTPALPAASASGE